MKFSDLYEALVGASQQSGSYVGMKLSDDSIGIIQEIQKTLGLKNPVPMEKLHITMMYSMKPLNSTFQCSTKPITGPLEYTYEWFGPSADCLVIKLKGELSDKLRTRHNEIASYGGEHTYDPFSPHITLSYGEPEESMMNIRDKINTTVYPSGQLFKLVSEYHEPVNQSWSDDLKK